MESQNRIEMARTSLISFDTVKGSTRAMEVSSKLFNQLNGFDPAIYKGADLWILSDTICVKEVTKNNRTYKRLFFWALDVNDGQLVELKATSIKTAMGYTECPNPGMWVQTDDHKWWVLKPKADDPALKSFVRWGIGEILPNAFEEVGTTIKVPHVIRLQITDIDYVTSKSPIDANGDRLVVEEAKNDTSFVPGTTRRWHGTASYPTKEELAQMVQAHNDKHPELLIDLKKWGKYFHVE